jgi:hypothetical protein
MSEPIISDSDAQDAAAFLERSAGAPAPTSLIVALMVLLAVLIGGYYLVGLDRMEAGQAVAPATIAADGPGADA